MIHDVNFWINPPELEKILCTAKTIDHLNQISRQYLPDLLFDLTQYPAYVDANAICNMILENEFTYEPRFINGKAVSDGYYQSLLSTMNLDALQGMVQVEYGFTLRRSDVRTFPTSDFYVKSPEDQEFDRFQETVLDPAEPLIVLHHSADEKWRFVQAANYRGWIQADAIVTSKDRCLWLKYISASNFLIVTGNRLVLCEEPYLSEFSNLTFAMGAKLPLVKQESIPPLIGNRSPISCYVVLLPVRDHDGALDFRMALIPKSADVHHGYLPFSRANLLRQAFKMQGDRYGWGGLFGSRDCSALVQDVYRSVGIFLARNAGEQAQGAGTNISFTDKSPTERIALLRSLPPGATLHFPGHVMLYLGEYQSEFYVIHAIAGCGDPTRRQPDGTLAPMPLNSIMVTDLSLRRTNGKTLLESLTEANLIP